MLIPNELSATTPETGGNVKKTAIPIDKIRPNRLQPRKYFDPEKLSALAASIKKHGIAQPLLVAKDGGDGHYELIAGERRLRAAELAGLKEVDVVVRESPDDAERLGLALIENLQRDDLNPIEEALGYLKLMEDYKHTQAQIAELAGKSRSAIANILRLLDLPDDMQAAMQEGKISEGHGRALLMIKDPVERKKLFAKMLDESLSVRASESLANDKNASSRSRKLTAKSSDILDIESRLMNIFGTKVEINVAKLNKKGFISIHFYSIDEFEKVINLLNKC
jgi:ParB family chromosome partitioning protein